MTRGEEQAKASVWETAWKCLKKNINGIASVAMVTAALRIAVFLPLLLCVDFGGKLPLWMGCALGAAVYILGVIPMRFWGREKMRRMVYSRHMNHKKKGVYKKWLKTGLLRYARGIVWGLPFLAGTVYFTVFRTRLDVKTFWMPIRNLAILVGQESNINTGAMVALALMLAAGLLFAYGWWRDLPFEYLPARSLGPVKTLHWSRRILKKHRSEMRKNTFVNFFLALPAWIGLGAVLAPYALKDVDFSLSPEMVLSQLLRLLRSPLPQSVLLMLGGVVLLLYVPFWILRKTRNTALIATLMRSHDHASHSSGHGNSDQAHEGSAASAEAKKVDFHAGEENGEEKAAPAPEHSQTHTEKDKAKEAALKAQEAARKAREAAEQAARLADDAANMAREVAESKQE